MTATDNSTAPILGLHHVTAIASDPQRNLDFYTQVLGLRLVKLTVNFDDPGTYHFYFGDGEGHPGTILTFFPWPGAKRGAAGNGQTTETAFAVPLGSLDFWRARLEANGVKSEPLTEHFGDAGLRFEDPDGMVVALIEDTSAPELLIWREGGVPAKAGIRGFHSVTLSLDGYEPTAQLLTEQMGFRLEKSEGPRHRFLVDDGGAGRTLDLVCQPAGPQARSGAGTVHHIAWRVTDDAAQETRRNQLTAARYNVSPVMDREYFHSIYFREPGGVLFEIATDPPGFTVDEPLESLGTHLKLPAQYESARQQIEKIVLPLQLPQF